MHSNVQRSEFQQQISWIVCIFCLLFSKQSTLWANAFAEIETCVFIYWNGRNKKQNVHCKYLELCSHIAFQHILLNHAWRFDATCYAIRLWIFCVSCWNCCCCCWCAMCVRINACIYIMNIKRGAETIKRSTDCCQNPAHYIYLYHRCSLDMVVRVWAYQKPELEWRYLWCSNIHVGAVLRFFLCSLSIFSSNCFCVCVMSAHSSTMHSSLYVHDVYAFILIYMFVRCCVFLSPASSSYRTLKTSDGLLCFLSGAAVVVVVCEHHSVNPHTEFRTHNQINTHFI